jgi:hypothetical protein
MSYPVSSTFEKQRTDPSNILKRQLSVFFPTGGYGLTGLGSTWDAQSQLTSQSGLEDSVFDPTLFNVSDVGNGNRSHRNFGQEEGNTDGGFGWQGGLRYSAGGGLAPGVVGRDLGSPIDSRVSNNGLSLAERFQAESVSASPQLVQFALRVEFGTTTAIQTVEIHADAAGLPAAPVLATKTFGPTDPVDDWITLDIPALSLTPGAFYWIVLTSAPNAASAVTWGAVATPPATVNEFAATNNGGGWVARAYRQHYRTVFSDGAVPLENADRVTVMFGQTRTISQIRLYSFPSGVGPSDVGLGIQTFSVQVHSGGVWSAASLGVMTGADYNNPRLTPTIVGGQVTHPSATYWELNLTAPVAIDGVRFTITQVQANALFATLIAAEFYVESDISNRVKIVEYSHKRNTLIDLDQSAQISIEADNSDRFFSKAYPPTPQQTAAGFHNSEWDDDIEIRYREGFNNGELVPQGIFYLDGEPLVTAKSRTAHLVARDWSKHFERTYVTENAILNDSIVDLISLMANRSNWSQSRMVLAYTQGRVSLFAPNGTTVRQEIEYLAQASPTATIRFDLTGTMVSIQYLPSMSSEQMVYADTLATRSNFQLNQRFLVPLMTANRKIYLGPSITPVGPYQSAGLVEYDPVTNMTRFLLIQNGVNAFLNWGSMALSADGKTLYAGQSIGIYKIDLTTNPVGVSFVNLSGLVNADGAFSHIGDRNCKGVIANNHWYFTAVFGGAPQAAEHLMVMDLTSGMWVLGNVTDLGKIASGGAGVVDATNSVITRMVRWTNGGFDRIVWSGERMTYTVFATFYGLPADSSPGLGNENFVRHGVTTDGTYLYEETVSNVSGQLVATVNRRDSSNVVTNQFTATINTGIADGCVGLAYAGGRLMLSTSVLVGAFIGPYASATNIFQNVLIVFNLQDASVYQVVNTQSAALGVIVDDPTTGIVTYLESPDVLYTQFAPSAGVASARLNIRTIQMPNNPIIPAVTAAWNTELLDAVSQGTVDNQGVPSFFTSVEWAVTPVQVGQPQPVWVASLHGSVISTTNPLTLPDGYSITFQPKSGAYPGPRFIAKRPKVGRLTVPISNQFSGFACPIATAEFDQGPFSMYPNGPTSAPDNTNPQAVYWTCSQGQIQTQLTPHSTAPILTIKAVGGGLPVIVTDLHIQAMPYILGNQSTVKVVSDGFLVDGKLKRQKYGPNDHQVQTPYVSDVSVVQMAGHELLRLYGTPIRQIKNVQLVPSPQFELEDQFRIQEPESSLDLTALVTSVTRHREDKANHDSYELQALPYASIFGISASPANQVLQNNPSMSSS